MNYWEMMPEFDAVLVYLAEIDTQKSMASMEWDLHHMARLNSVRIWSDWQFKRYPGTKFRFTYQQLAKASKRLSGSSTSSATYSSGSSSSLLSKSTASGLSSNTIARYAHGEGCNLMAVLRCYSVNSWLMATPLLEFTPRPAQVPWSEFYSRIQGLKTLRACDRYTLPRGVSFGGHTRY